MIQLKNPPVLYLKTNHIGNHYNEKGFMEGETAKHVKEVDYLNSDNGNQPNIVDSLYRQHES